MVDYIQLVAPAGRRDENRATEVAQISRDLKLLARELHVPVLACAQLNRCPEARNDKRPLLGDLRGSRALEMDADHVLLIDRDHYYLPHAADPAEAELIVAKNRHGPTGTIHLRYAGSYARFDSTT